MLRVNDLSFRYHKGPQILNDVGFELEGGRFMAILGNNGVGKSTMLKCFNRILNPQSGSVSLDGEELLALSQREIAKRIAFVAQSVPETQMTVHDVVMLGRRPYMSWGFTDHDHDIVHEAMLKLGLMDMRGRFLNELSGGERQKVVLARALAQQPKLLLLDEPTSSLDLKNQYQVLSIVRDICHESGITAIVVIHDLNLALRFCDSFLLMKGGHVHAFGDRSILTRDSIREVYGVNAELAQVGNQHIVLVDEE